MDWNEFNRELQNRVSDPGVRYCFGIVYERLLDISKQVDMCANIVTEMADTMASLASFSEFQAKSVNELRRHIDGTHDGVSVESVPITNEERND